MKSRREGSNFRSNFKWYNSNWKTNLKQGKGKNKTTARIVKHSIKSVFCFETLNNLKNRIGNWNNCTNIGDKNCSVAALES